ncbi:KxYKxGKxW signal peptide domain-containing protein [Lactococcus lactis subsp. lactis]|uniref:KxYKxGKxW signal peptide domain-containing protein n=1 Tax=Lactococcus lactis TaxID=1358 RepID=UPI00374A59BB
MEKQKHHFRTWKSGKIWLFSSGILLIFVIGRIELTAQADEVTSNTETATQSSDVTTQSSPVSPTVNSSLAASDSTTEEPAVVSNMENTAQASSSTNILTTESSTVDTNSPTQSNQSSIAISLTKASSESSINEPASTIANETTTTADVTTQTTATQAQTSDPTTSLSSESQGKPKNPSQSKSPEITNIQVTGAVDNNATGSAVFDGVNIMLQGKDISDDNLLDPSGLHWSEQTQVIAIKGTATGQLNQENFGVQDGPIIPATTYTMNDGDSGRITYVGKTLSGLDLDMIYTVASSDKNSWQANEGADGIPQGLTFTGEQNIADSGGNSIVCLYNGANALSLIYQIVKHDTTTEVPVVASFITTDIDIAQGVQTDLANLVTILPQTTNLKQDGDTIYDASPNYPGLDGVASLPYGGYLGAGFVSEFYYNYYAPAPERAEDSYFFAQGVRYDLFGSALQAHMNTQIRQNITINYLDEFEHTIAPTDYYFGFTNQDYNLPIPTYPNYSFVSMTENDNKPNYPVINLIYQPKPYVYNPKNNNDVSYAGINYRPNITFNYQNEGYANSTVTYTPQNSQTAEAIDIPLIWKPAQVDIITPNFKTVSYDTSKKDNTNDTGLSESQLSNFEKNLGFNRNESVAVIDYMNEAAIEARRNHQDVNHAVDNALAYQSYHIWFPNQKYWDNFQPFYNEFGKVPFASDDLKNALNTNHGSNNKYVDFPHLATDLAASENSGNAQSLIQRIGGVMIFGRIPVFVPKNMLQYIILQQDGYTGDVLSGGLNKPDSLADLDAEIFNSSPAFSNKLRTKQIIDMYTQSPKKLEKTRRIEHEKVKGINSMASLATLLTPAGAALALLGMYRSRRQLKSYFSLLGKWFIGNVKDLGDTILSGAKKILVQTKKVTGNLLNKVKTFFTGSSAKADTVTVKNASATTPIKSVTNSLSSLKTQANKVFNQGVKSVSKVFNSFVNTAKAAGQNAKSFFNQSVKMAQQSLNTAIRVAKEAVQRAAELARQTANWVGQNIRNVGNTVWNGLKSVYNGVSSFVGNVYNNYVTPVVKTVTKTVSNFVNSAVKLVSNVVHSVVNTVKSVASKVVNTVKKVAKSVGNWFKSLW